jgi:peptidoglycan/xylan/chitin deacetylase (PgdA/CDA1 family)
VTWTVDPRDYLHGGHPGSVVRAIVRADEAGHNEKRGEVLLLHDNQAQTVHALAGIIDHYEGSGRSFASVGDLAADKYTDP